MLNFSNLRVGIEIARKICQLTIVSVTYVYGRKAMKVKKRYQGMAEYLIVFMFVVLALIVADLFLFGFTGSGKDESNTFAGSLVQLHDRIVSVISAPIP